MWRLQMSFLFGFGTSFSLHLLYFSQTDLAWIFKMVMICNAHWTGGERK